MGWRRLAGVALVSAAASVAGGYLLLPLAVRFFVRGLVLTTNACIWFAASLSAGVDGWTIMRTIAGSARDALATGELVGAAGVLLVVGAAALWGLQRLLGSEEESSR